MNEIKKGDMLIMSRYRHGKSFIFQSQVKGVTPTGRINVGGMVFNSDWKLRGHCNYATTIIGKAEDLPSLVTVAQFHEKIVHQWMLFRHGQYKTIVNALYRAHDKPDKLKALVDCLDRVFGAKEALDAAIDDISNLVGE